MCVCIPPWQKNEPRAKGRFSCQEYCPLEPLQWEKMPVTKCYTRISMQTVMFDMHVRDLMWVNMQRWSEMEPSLRSDADSVKNVLKYGNGIQSGASAVLLVNKTQRQIIVSCDFFTAVLLFRHVPSQTNWLVSLFIYLLPIDMRKLRLNLSTHS